LPIHLPTFPAGWSCYLLLCQDGSYYCGITEDLGQRLRDHASGKGSTYTKGTKAEALVWFEFHPNRKSAARRERKIKKWGRKKKQSLAAGGVWVSLVRPTADSG